MIPADKMGNTLDVVYEKIASEFTRLHTMWREYKSLFTQDENVHLLNQTASSFFGMVQIELFNGVLLRICRLLDPSSSGNDKENLTLNRLCDLIREGDNNQFGKSIENDIRVIKENSDTARNWRTKYIAHNDLRVAIREVKLDDIEYRNIDEIIARIARILNKVSLHYEHGSQIWPELASVGGTENLLYVLKCGITYIAQSDSM